MCLNKKSVLAGLAAGAVIFVLSFAVEAVIQAVMPYKWTELGPIRDLKDPLMTAFWLHPFVIGLVASMVYQWVGKRFHGNWFEKGKKLGLLMWFIVAVPETYMLYTSMNYPAGFYVSLVFGYFIYYTAAGLVVAKLSK